MKRALIFFTLLLAISPAYAAIGVTPPSYDIDFQPNLKQVFHFTFLGDKDTKLKIEIQNGSLSQYATLSTDEIKGTGTVFVAIKFPETVDTPGLNGIGISATQIPPDDSQGIYLVGKILAQIRVRVPYPGQYAESTITTENANAGDPVKASFTVWSRGSQEIETTTRIDIYDFEKKVASIPLGNKILGSAESNTVYFVIDTSSYSAGKYRAVAVTDYNGKQVTAESSFRLGELFVDVANYSNYLTRDKINRFEIYAESFWNDPIDSIYAEVNVIGYPQSFLTPTSNLRGFETKTLTGFLDTNGITNDTFFANITLHYHNTTSGRIVQVEFSKEINYIKYAIVAGIIVVIAALVILIYIMFGMRRKLKEKRR